ncbi:MAG: Eco29kI family restriction endonuclease [Desulfococcaceae bacterium]
MKIDGFGKTDPGKGRYQQQKSARNALHPGRPWTERLQPNGDADIEIKDKAAQYISDAMEKF